MFYVFNREENKESASLYFNATTIDKRLSLPFMARHNNNNKFISCRKLWTQQWICGEGGESINRKVIKFDGIPGEITNSLQAKSVARESEFHPREGHARMHRITTACLIALFSVCWPNFLLKRNTVSRPRGMRKVTTTGKLRSEKVAFA